MRGASIPKSSRSSSSVRRTRPNTVRIIGGLWRSRILEFPDAADLRPTPDRVRETLFNWLGRDLTGMDCLDLFAGSGHLLGGGRVFGLRGRGARRGDHLGRGGEGVHQVLQGKHRAQQWRQVDRVMGDRPHRV